MPGRLTKAVILLGALAVLFALVCPLAPTPTAVRIVKQASQAVILIALPLVLPPLALTDQGNALLAAAAPIQDLLDITDLTCTRIC